MPKLIDNTVVVHPETGEPVLLAATGELPHWAVGLVGDHLLDDTPPPTSPGRGDDENARLRARIAELEAQAAGTGTGAAKGAKPEVPPRGGPGSGALEWRAYARSLGVEVADTASREDVIKALDAAGMPTE